MSSSAEVLLALEEKRRGAMLAGDTQTLLALLDPKLRYVHSTGVCDSREGLLNKLTTGQIVYRQLSLANLTASLEEHVGVVTGEMHAQVLRGGELRSVNACYLAIWLNRAGKWQMVALQSTALP